MSKASKIKSFDPNSAGAGEQVFGLPFTCEEADIVLVPVPWEVTTSYGGGTSRGPKAILEASFQVDLFHPEFPGLWKRGIAMDEMPRALLEQSDALKKRAKGGRGAAGAKALKLINEECAVMNEWVEARTAYWLDQGKLVGLVGGDHSTPLGYFRALAARHEAFGILHIDAHMDLRAAYEGFTFSHASIMRNALAIPTITALVQVGIRDRCEEENAWAAKERDRVRVHAMERLRAEQFSGTTWTQQCDRILAALPEKVHVSFDIDGLDPSLCPHTGTPVPGGLGFAEATHLLSRIRESGRQVIGFDLVEVAPGPRDEPNSAEASAGEWDANVGARMLWHLCGVLAR